MEFLYIFLPFLHSAFLFLRKYSYPLQLKHSFFLGSPCLKIDLEEDKAIFVERQLILNQMIQ